MAARQERKRGFLDRIFHLDKCGPEGRHFKQKVIPNPPKGGSAVMTPRIEIRD
jgi:hypothetical protein